MADVLSEEDLNEIAKTVLAEAQRTKAGAAPGEQRAVRADAIAIAHVINNRVIDNTRNKQFGQSVRDVLDASRQFTARELPPTAPNNPNKVAAANPHALEEVKNVVRDVFSGKIPDPTGGMTQYYSPTGMVPRGVAPSWWAPEVAKAGGKIYEVPGSPHRMTGPFVPPDALQNPTTAGAIRALQSQLIAAGLLQGPPTGVMDPATVQAKTINDELGLVSLMQAFATKPPPQPKRKPGREAPNTPATAAPSGPASVEEVIADQMLGSGGNGFPSAPPGYDPVVAQAVQNVMGANTPAAPAGPTSLEDIIAGQGTGLPARPGSTLDMEVARALTNAMAPPAAQTQFGPTSQGPAVSSPTSQALAPSAPNQRGEVRDERKVSFEPAGTVDRAPSRFDIANEFASRSGVPADIAVAAATLAGRSPEDTWDMLSGASRDARASGIDIGQVPGQIAGMSGDLTLSQAIDRAAGPLGAMFASDRVNNAKNVATSAFGPSTTVDAVMAALDRAGAQLSDARPPASSMVTAPIDPPRAETVAAAVSAFSPSARSEAGSFFGSPMSAPTRGYDPVADWVSRSSRSAPQAGSSRVVGAGSAPAAVSRPSAAPVSGNWGEFGLPGAVPAVAPVGGRWGEFGIPAAPKTGVAAPVPQKKPVAPPAKPKAVTPAAPKTITPPPPAPPPPAQGTRENPYLASQISASTPAGSFVETPSGSVGRTMGGGAGSVMGVNGAVHLTGTGEGESYGGDPGTVVCTWLYGRGEVSRTDWKRMQVHGARDVDPACLLGYSRIFGRLVALADDFRPLAAVLRYLFWLYAEGVIRPRRRPISRAIVCGGLAVVCRLAAPRRVDLAFPAEP